MAVHCGGHHSEWLWESLAVALIHEGELDEGGGVYGLPLNIHVETGRNALLKNMRWKGFRFFK